MEIKKQLQDVRESIARLEAVSAKRQSSSAMTENIHSLQDFVLRMEREYTVTMIEPERARFPLGRVALWVAVVICGVTVWTALLVYGFITI